MKLPPPIELFFEAFNLHDADAVVARFASDALVADEGRKYRGAEIKVWIDKVNADYKPKAKVISVVRAANKHVVTAQVRGSFLEAQFSCVITSRSGRERSRLSSVGHDKRSNKLRQASWEGVNTMWPVIILCLVAIAFAAVWFGLLPPPHASTLVQVRAGSVRVTRGKLRPEAREQVREILAEVGVARGFVAVTPGDRVAFSWNIPGTVHQRLRNVLLNQWA